MVSTKQKAAPTKLQERAEKGLKIPRFFTEKGKDPFAAFEYERRTSKITNPDGSVVFEMKNLEVPKGWSQVAADIMAQKYCRKKGVPQRDEKGNIKKDENGNVITGAETSVKMVVGRLAATWRHWGETNNYFNTTEDAQAFEDELNYMLTAQMAAPNSPQWFNTGLAHAYGITGDAQGHYYIDPDTEKLTKSKDAYTRPQPHACFIQSVKDDLVNEGGIFDLITREALLFKYGSGTGTNFSKLRGQNESLSGGGKSSGLMSFLAVLDRAAGAIKSGGTTRRAAKMVCLDMDHPEVEDFIDWKVIEEQKVAALNAGSHICFQELKKIITSAYENGLDPEKNPQLRKLIREADEKYVPLKYIKRVLQQVEEGLKPEEFDFRRYDTDFRSEAYLTVGGQNSNNSVRVPNTFIDAVKKDGQWDLINRTDNKVYKSMPARKMWDKIAYAAWSSADPGIQYDSTINEWHTCPEDGRINASNPCSEYMFLDDTACNLASLNLIKFYDTKTQTFDIDAYKHAARLWTIVLEISVLMAQFPSKSIATLSYDFRTLGLGYANIGTLLMQMGIPYTSEEAYSICGAMTAILCGESYATSAEMAKIIAPFRKYEKNKEHMLRVIRNHRRAAYNAARSEYEGLTVTPQGINPLYCGEALVAAARDAWDRALEWGEKYGYRNAQVTVIAPTGTIGLLMDCDTTGIEPDFALVKFKKLVGGGYFKIV
ncbi:MAG TPA: adenosylcobalamin-dependent ribonucleoside-diphosphate reductase, partial [Candidatus Gracilibacteria bacterium]|nr:adenosylcobalamin-dependent ribonucleoside-diphosphate reductase [Candidatus Gracilibacteria bacterium]